jgi:hypothetical protein
MKSLRLAVDRIVVEGLRAAEPRRFAAALEARLREFAQEGFPQEFASDARRTIRSLSAGRLRPGATPDEAARQVVNAIRRGLGANGASETFIGSGRGGGEAKGDV